ncbi:MAG TPA: EAL domain-containing protein [Mycobacteriales bacterium]|nr:EAL domain-containing protein [Mycobacteriales bacterium]
MSDRRTLATALRNAAELGELEVHYQPELSFATGEITGVEALLRWYSRSFGLLWPADFLPVADSEDGLTASLGSVVLLTVGREASTWFAAAPTTQRTVWVNLSGTELADSAALRAAEATVVATGLPAGALGLHLPAQTLADAGSALLPALRRAHAAGIRLAADGVHPGQADTLGAHPLDVLVLARDVVRSLDSDLGRRHEVEVLTHAAHEAGRVVASVGVESWAEADVLAQLGVDRATGYLFGAPQRADRMRWLLAQSAESWRGTFATDEGARAASSLPWLHDALPASALSRAAEPVASRWLTAV